MSGLIYKQIFKYKCQGCGNIIESTEAGSENGFIFGPNLPPCPNGCYYVPSDWGKKKNTVYPIPARVERPAQNIKDFVEQQKKIPY